LRIYLRLRHYDHHPVNVKHFGYSTNDLEDGQNENPRDTARQRTVSAESVPSYNGPYLQRLSYSSQPPFEVDFGPSLGERQLSYDHRRDTQFEDYVVAKRASLGLKENVDHAIGTEFGWGRQRPSIADAATQRPGSVIGSGIIAVAKAPRREDAKRVKSWTADRVLGSLQEGVDEDSGNVHDFRHSSVEPLRMAKTRASKVGEYQHAVRSHARSWSDDQSRPPFRSLA
jgi:hypothetical protein